jgi:hypothetical protein
VAVECLALRTVVGAERERAVLGDERDAHELSREQTLAARDDLLEHGFSIRDRARDRSEHFARCALLLERLLGLVEQTDVLERDRRLIAEGLQQGDLALGERAHLQSTKEDRAERPPLAEQRYDDDRAMAVALRELRAERKAGSFGKHVRNVHRPPLEERPTGNRLAVDRERLHMLHGLRKRALHGEMTQHAALGQVHRCRGSVAQPRRTLADRIEHRLHVGGRPRDHAQDFRDCGLLREAFLRLVE